MRHLDLEVGHIFAKHQMYACPFVAKSWGIPDAVSVAAYCEMLQWHKTINCHTQTPIFISRYLPI